MTHHLTVGEADSSLASASATSSTDTTSPPWDATTCRSSPSAVDDGEGLVAGLGGWTWGTCAGIGMPWVRDADRRAGWGGRMLAAAEQEARDHGCRQLLVPSFTFQAPDFYVRHGYVEFARSPDLPLEGEADVHFLKLL